MKTLGIRQFNERPEGFAGNRISQEIFVKEMYAFFCSFPLIDLYRMTCLAK